MNDPVLPPAYPLAWPDDYVRTDPTKRVQSKFRADLQTARDELERELSLFRIRKAVISANLPLRIDGRLRADKSTPAPADPGVAVWWIDPKDGAQRVIACDQWRLVRENMRACWQAIAAMRALERSGASQILERVVESFAVAQLPASGNALWWWSYLELSEPFDLADVEAAYKRLLFTKHPDHGGTHEDFLQLEQARSAARAYLGKRRAAGAA